MNLFENKKRKIIKNEYLLTQQFIPKQIIGRKDKIQNIARTFSPLFSDYPFMSNILIYGSTGTGKTLILNYVLEQLKIALKNKKWEYNIINVQTSKANSKYKIFKKVYSDLYSRKAKGMDTSELHEKIIQKFCDDKKITILFIDEIHEMSKSSELNNLIYSISRFGEDIARTKSKSLDKSNKKTLFAYVIISNDNRIIDRIRGDTKSSFDVQSFIFKKYSPEELYKILKNRIDLGALHKNAINDENIHRICAITTREGDARYAIKLLKLSANQAENQNSEKIKEKDIESANEYLRHNYLKEVLKDLNYLELDVLNCIFNIASGSSNNLTTKKVYDLFLEKNPKSVGLSRVSQIVSKLAEQSIIQANISYKGGQTRKISIEETKDIIRECLLQQGLI